MQIMAFDQATQKTGVAMFQDGKYLWHKLIDVHKIKNSDERFRTMIQSIWELIAEWKPDYVVIEDTVLQRSPATMKQLSQLQGAIIGCCIGKRIPYDILYPATWRKAMGFSQGKGIKREELKKQAQTYVKEKYNIVATDDESDAICIGLSYIQKNQKSLEDEAC